MANTEIISKHIKNLKNKSSLYVAEDWIWLRVHKTAGTSMYDYYLRNYCINESKDFDYMEYWVENVNDQDLKDKYIWSFVRNPYDRFLSAASMFNLHPNDFANRFDYIRAKKNIIKRHTEPQHIFTHYEGHQIPHFIGKYENLENDWRKVLDKINLPYFLLPVSNSSSHGDWREQLTEQTKEFIREFYRLDFKYYGYEN